MSTARVVLVFPDGIQHSVALRLHEFLVLVVEAVPLVFHPDADGDSDAELLAAIEEGFAVDLLAHRLDAPGADRVAAGIHQQLEIFGAADTLCEKRLAISRQGVAAIGLAADFHFGTDVEERDGGSAERESNGASMAKGRTARRGSIGGNFSEPFTKRKQYVHKVRNNSQED